MKKTTKLKIWGIIQLVIGVIIFLVSIINFMNMDYDNPVFSMIGTMIGFIIGTSGFTIVAAGFKPEITKLKSDIQKETIDHAGKEISEATAKTADTIIPAVTPSLRKAYTEISGKKTIEEQLLEAKNLLDKELITNEEYELLRKNILGL